MCRSYATASTVAIQTPAIYPASSISTSARKVGEHPVDMAFHGDELFVACQGDGSVHLIDVPARRHKANFQAGKGCESLGFF
jgi:hypothetical protein